MSYISLYFIVTALIFSLQNMTFKNEILQRKAQHFSFFLLSSYRYYVVFFSIFFFFSFTTGLIFNFYFIFQIFTLSFYLYFSLFLSLLFFISHFVFSGMVLDSAFADLTMLAEEMVSTARTVRVKRTYSRTLLLILSLLFGLCYVMLCFAYAVS